MPEADMIIHAGDISTIGTVAEVASFVNWYASLPYKHKIFICGNHDRGFEDIWTKTKMREILAQHPEVTYLQDSEVIIEGIKIYGSPWQPWFHNWAFNGARGEFLKKIWSRIPDDTDILITHGPPYGYGDMVKYTNERVGCEDLLNRILEVKPKLCIFGHVHEGYGMFTIRHDREGNEIPGMQITAINASIMDADYFPVNEPVVIDYEDFL